MMLTMANTDDFVQQLAASEALIAATQKKKDSSMIVSQVIVKKWTVALGSIFQLPGRVQRLSPSKLNMDPGLSHHKY